MSHVIPLRNCSTSWILGAFADEAGPTTQEQIDAIKRAGLSHIDLRGIDGFNIADLPIEQAHVIHGKLTAAGIKVSMLGSPLGKIDIADDFRPELARLDHLGRLAEIFSCNAVRIFSYYNKNKEPLAVWERESIDRLRRLRDGAGDLGLILYHENERHIFGDDVENVLKIAHALRDPEGTKGPPFRMLFDFDNYNQGGQDVWAAWHKLRNLTDGFHLKDSDANNLHVPIGQGAGRAREILADALAHSWKGTLSLEPHLQHSLAVMATGPSGQANQKFSEMSSADCFDAAARCAKALLGEIRAPVM